MSEIRDLIAVNYETEQPTVSARNLHEQLHIETPFKKWIDRMCEYGFEEYKDFWTKMSESTGGRPSTEYEISIDMAKTDLYDSKIARRKTDPTVFSRSRESMEHARADLC